MRSISLTLLLLMTSCGPNPHRVALTPPKFPLEHPSFEHSRNDCRGAAMPIELSQIGLGKSVTAIGELNHSERTSLLVGEAAHIRLQALQNFRRIIPANPVLPNGSLERSGKVARGGFLTFTIREAGSYRIAANWKAIDDLGRYGGAAIDILQMRNYDRAVLPYSKSSVPCRIYTVLDYYLVPGDYALQLATTSAETLDVVLANATASGWKAQ